MLKVVGKFILLTTLVALAGSFLAAQGNDQEGGESSVLGVVGVLTFLFSPVIAGGWMYHQRRRRRDASEAVAAGVRSEEERKDELRRRFLERQRLIDSIDRYRTMLSRNLERAVKTNDYGKVTSDTTEDALDEFFASIDMNFSLIERDEAVEVVFDQLNFRRQEDRSAGFDATALPFDGHAFEAWVAEALIGFGWDAKVTSASGDQGIDVVARKGGKTVGLQCKLYSASVGNKAVQEAHAGKALYDADVVGVLTNAAFTSSARDLAQATGVVLLSHHDIPKLFEKMFGFADPAPAPFVPPASNAVPH